MKHLTRIALGLVVIAAFVYGFHWVGLHLPASVTEPRPEQPVATYVIVTLWGFISLFFSAIGIAIGVGIAHSIGGQFLRDKPVSRDHTEWGGEWKDNPNNGISPYDLPK